MKSRLKVSEIFHSLQGEGSHIGVPSVFIRMAGCDMKCCWCDTEHAQTAEGAMELTAEEVCLKVLDLGDKPLGLVVLTGGNPVLQDLSELVTRLNEEFPLVPVMVETQGTKSPKWLHMVELLCLSPKPPSSGMKVSFDALSECVNVFVGDSADRIKAVSVKIPVRSKEDFCYAGRVSQLAVTEWGVKQAVIIQPVAPIGKPGCLEEYHLCLSDYMNQLARIWSWMESSSAGRLRLLPQLHYMLWPGEKGR